MEIFINIVNIIMNGVHINKVYVYYFYNVFIDMIYYDS